MKKWIKTAVVVFLFALAQSLPAHADETTFNSIFFKPVTGRNPYLMLHGIDTLHKYQFQVGEFFSFGYRPLEVRQNNQRITGVVDYTFVSDFIAAFGVTEWLELGLDFPVVLLNSFQDPNVYPPPGYSNKISLGDLRLEAKARVMDACAFPVGLAFIPFVSVPTGKDEYYVGDPGITGGLIISTEGRVTRNFGITGNIGFKTGKKINFRNLEWQHRLLLGLGTYFQFGKGISVFGEVNSESAFEHFFNDRDMNMAEGLVGVKWDIKETGVTLNAGGGSCFVCGVKGALGRGALGVTYRWNPPKYRKLDDDLGRVCDNRFRGKLTAQQYYDLMQECPPNPADYREGIDDEACPKYYELREIADLLWRCPPKPEDFVQGVHDDACQKVYTLSDKYSEDEIWNAYSLSASEMGMRCPQNPENFNPSIHDQACPKYYELRELAMLSQKCPDNPSDWKQGVDDQACPKFYDLRDNYSEAQWAVIDLLSQKDTDGDGINDYLDVCPEREEDYNGFADEDGCPDGGVVAVVGGEILTYRPVYFEFNRADLSSDSMQILDIVIGVINSSPWIERLRIAGNADARGTDAANLTISKRRAQRVIDYMKSHGVRRNVTLIPIAYGASRPVATNTTERGRALNRRVFFGIEQSRYSVQSPTLFQRGDTSSSYETVTTPTTMETEVSAPEKESPKPAGTFLPKSKGVPQRWD